MLFAELVALPFFLNAGEGKQAVKISGVSICCAKKTAVGSCAKSSGAATEGPECCVNCPVFNVMITPQFMLSDGSAKTIERTYPSYYTSYSYTFYSLTWKPPDVC